MPLDHGRASRHSQQPQSKATAPAPAPAPAQSQPRAHTRKPSGGVAPLNTAGRRTSTPSRTSSSCIIPDTNQFTHADSSSKPRQPSTAPDQGQRASSASSPLPSITTTDTSSSTTSFLTSTSTPDRSNRESFVSIVDDPFFLYYDKNNTYDASLDGDPSEPEPGSLHHQQEHQRLKSHHRRQSSQAHPQNLKAGSDERAGSSSWPIPRRESLTIGPSPYLSHFVSPMDSYTIAVIGSAGAGKSTFIQRVLGLARRPISNSSSTRLAVDGVTYAVSLFELDLENFDQAASSQTIQWPKQINGHIVPKPDAALVLYDVMDQDSIRRLPKAMTAVRNANLPSSLVACKCDNDEDEWEVDADGMALHKVFQQCIGSFKVTSDRPDLSKTCLTTMLKAAIAHRKGNPHRTPLNTRLFELNSLQPAEEQSETVSRRRAQSQSAANLDAPDSAVNRPLSQQSKHSRASSELSVLKGFGNASNPDSYKSRASKSPRPLLRSDKPGTDFYLDVEESDSENRYSDDVPILQRSEESIAEKPKATGVPFDELVDRLLALRLSRADNNFSDIFLCLYRKFASPRELFGAILSRLDGVRDDKSAHYLTKTATQLRIIEVVAKWVSLYPGDFAKIATRRKLFEFIQHLSTEPIFSIASQQMRRSLRRSNLEDDDTGWANSDESDDPADDEEYSKEMGELSESIGMVYVDDEAESVDAPPDFAGQPGGQIQFHSYDEYEREASSLEPSDLHPMNKTRYHIFMEISDDDIADELTRIDWILFSSTRIRDFVRHVSLSASQKGKTNSLRNVNRMINHFNHVAKWVANLILLRDKAKHRAQMLEKFMNIAIKLRQLNNYNGLAAVLAGINGTAVHRLAQTRQLVPAEIQKRFARTVILMGTQKSHSAYRLAWENSPLPRIPFIPLHLRDLVSAEEGSMTFVGPNGDRVNWRKFEVLGEVLLPLMKSQGTAYPNLAKNKMIRELILGCRMPTDDEEIYQRSLELESSNSPSAFDPSKKKFPWFAK